jgi:hypothetical protein
MTRQSWRFEDSPNDAVFTTQSVGRGVKPILYVSRDEDDGTWQFHSGDDVSVKDAMVLSLEEVVVMDPSIEQLADLPRGWIATRSSSTAAWVKTPRSPPRAPAVASTD